MKLLLISVILLLSLGCQASANNVKYTGTFSDLYYNKEGGDLLGYEIRIVYTRNGYQGTFQDSEGEPSALILIQKIMVDGNVIKFSIPKAPDCEYEFIGQITTDGLLGNLTFCNDNKIELNLKRGKSYWD